MPKQDDPQTRPSDPERLLRSYMDDMRLVRNRTPSTRKDYELVLSQWLLWLGSRHPLTASIEEMRGFVTRGNRPRRAVGGQPRPATVKKEVAILRSFYRWAWEQGYTAQPIAAALHGPTVHNEMPHPVPDGEWRAIWPTPMSPQLRAAVGLGYFCGLRRSEIAELHTDHFDGDEIIGLRRKGGHSDNVVPWRQMVEMVADRLPVLAEPLGPFYASMEMLCQEPGYLTAMHDRSIKPDPQVFNHRLLRWFAARDFGFSFSPHMLRHSCATNLVRIGMPLPMVRTLMNHASITVTQRYVRAGVDELAEWRRGAAGQPNRW